MRDYEAIAREWFIARENDAALEWNESDIAPLAALLRREVAAAYRDAMELAEGALHSLPEDRSQDDELDATGRYSNGTVRIIMANLRARASEVERA